MTVASSVGSGLSGSGAGGLGSIRRRCRNRSCGATSNGRRGAGRGLPPPPPAGPSAGRYTTFNGIGGLGRGRRGRRKAQHEQDGHGQTGVQDERRTQRATEAPRPLILIHGNLDAAVRRRPSPPGSVHSAHAGPRDWRVLLARRAVRGLRAGGVIHLRRREQRRRLALRAAGGGDREAQPCGGRRGREVRDDDCVLVTEREVERFDFSAEAFRGRARGLLARRTALPCARLSRPRGCRRP